VAKILNKKYMWESKIHVKGSLPKKDSQFSLFIGRWQPLHDGHKALFQQVLNKGDKVCIAIRDVEPDEKNPYTSVEVFKNITKFYQNNILLGQVRVIIIPDICSVDFGRGVGYDIVEWLPPSEIGEISATKIREAMKNNQNDSSK
jgi:cytidyltransferase-like protein